ncbi:MAG: RDD family protein [Polaromonas sp.]
MESSSDLEYAGFWIRVWASLIDTVLLAVLVYPLLTAIYGRNYWSGSASFVRGPLDFLLSWVLPAIVVLLFWLTRQATPGKMAIGARIVDAKTGQKPSTAQLLGRYLGYFVSAMPLCLGLFWVGIDPRKQGWHDKLAGTVVVRKKGGATEPVRFGGG